MKEINPDVIPALPVTDLIAGESVAIGVFDYGVIISYLERDHAVLVEWSELVEMGKAPIIETVTANIITEVREIEKPTK